MYSREEVKRLKESFWTSFGQYMSVVAGHEGDKIAWVNYKTGIKHVHFRMQAKDNKALIAVELVYPQESIRYLMLEQFKQFAVFLFEELGEEWVWEEVFHDDNGKPIARIYKEITNVNVLNIEDWPELISFFKPRIIALDRFWTNVKYEFEYFKN